MKYKLTLIALTAAFAMFSTTIATAQERSGRGINERAARQVDCLAEVAQLETIVQRLDEHRQALLKCNAQGMLFAGDYVGTPGQSDPVCVEMTQLAHEWRPAGYVPSGGDLAFLDDGTEVSVINVIRGRDGEDAVCPPDYDPVD